MLRAHLAAIALLLGANTPPDYPKLRSQAERLIAEKSFSEAHELYERLAKADLPAPEKRWVAFRLADTLWRSQDIPNGGDPSKLDQARRDLQALIQNAPRPEDRDRVWAEVQESLGDFSWLRTRLRSSSGWSNYQQALDWWAGAADIELARERYLAMVRKAALPPWRETSFYYGHYGTLPLPIAQSFLKIAKTDADKILGHYLIAMTLYRSGGDYESRARIPEEFDAALKGGKANDWYDDALWQYGQFLETQGRLAQQENGGWRQEPDHPAALAVYRRILSEFKKGETRFYDQARERIADITGPTLSLSAAGLFLPDTAPQISLSWRNVKAIDLVLYQVDFLRDLKMGKRPKGEGGEDDLDDPVHRIDLAQATRVKAWSKETGDAGKHLPGSQMLRWPDKLPAGAYVLEATAEGVRAKRRDLLLVTDTVVTVKAMGTQVVAWFTSALSGAPIAGASALLWHSWYEDGNTRWASQTGTANADGIASFQIPHKDASSFVAAAALGARQALAQGAIGQPPSSSKTWRIYAFTDRPAYRPKEKAELKFVARAYDGSVYSTPKGEKLFWEITDPRGAKAFEGAGELDAFGTLSGAVELEEKHPLGEYRVSFRNASTSVGQAALFRLEEYKLPEFTVKVALPKEGGRPRIYRVGDTVEAEVQVDYYFGGAVANADVEVLVHQSPYLSYWRPPRNYPWYYDDLFANPYGGYRYDSIVKREVLKTDASGAARVSFETPRGAGQDFEYRVEARVTDSSRREVVSAEAVRVARQRFYVHATPRHSLFRPKEKVVVDFKALDANDNPVQAEGKLLVTREWWTEIWLDPGGKEMTGAELARARQKGPLAPGFRLKHRGYHHEEVEKRAVKTDEKGEIEASFAFDREGYYLVHWVTDEKGRNAITADAAVWVASDATTELGYFRGGLQIVVDKDTFQVGQEAPVMLSVPSPDRYVLFAVEGEDLYHWRVVHVTGTVKLLHVAVEARHVPNVFLDATMVSDQQRLHDVKQIIVPPTASFLDVSVAPDRDAYQPREEATLAVSARDHQGKPVAAQFAVAFVDESVFSIQQDYAGDPRQFYFGAKRAQGVSTTSLLDWRGFVQPEPGPPEVGAALDEAPAGGDFGAAADDFVATEREAPSLAVASPAPEAQSAGVLKKAEAPADFKAKEGFAARRRDEAERRPVGRAQSKEVGGANEAPAPSKCAATSAPPRSSRPRFRLAKTARRA